jgi:hypothetical protein
MTRRSAAMTYPTYDIKFVGKLETVEGESKGEIETDGSHAFVLDAAGTKVQVALTHFSDEDRTPRLILEFKPAK